MVDVMSERFQVGEIAIYCPYGKVEPGLEIYDGEDVEVVRTYFVSNLVLGGVAHEIKCKDGLLITCTPQSLRKKRPPEYDGNQVASWDKCEWKPRELVRV